MNNTKGSPKQNTRTVTGTVVSTKNPKTVIVSVITMTKHPLYRKAMKKTTRFAAHIEELTVAVGDTVRMVETKPISKTKHYKVLEKITK